MSNIQKPVSSFPEETSEGSAVSLSCGEEKEQRADEEKNQPRGKGQTADLRATNKAVIGNERDEMDRVEQQSGFWRRHLREK